METAGVIGTVVGIFLLGIVAVAAITMFFLGMVYGYFELLQPLGFFQSAIAGFITMSFAGLLGSGTGIRFTNSSE